MRRRHPPRRRSHRGASALTALAVVGALAGACSDDRGAPGTPAAPGDASGRGVVVRVVDGDTLVVTLDGREHKVRLIGIDTPETKKPDTPVQCYGPEASQRLSQLLPVGTAVRLERDKELNDQYGRILAYVFPDGAATSVNETLLAEGDARILRIAPNTAYATTFADVAAKAERDRRGLWGACQP